MIKHITLLLLFIGLAFWNCEDDLPDDCAGVAGGSAVIDSCGVCDAEPTNDCTKDCAGVWGGENTCGCTDSTAANYDPEATFDDESCEYPVPLPMEFPLYENAGWIYNRYFYANEDDYDANIPEVVLQDTLFILTNVVEDGYYGFSWSSNAYYSLVKNYDNKFIAAGYHVFENDTTYFYDSPSIWASYDDVYDTNAINTDYASFPLNRTIVQDSLFENVYNAYKHDYDWYHSYVNSEGYSKFEINNVNDAFPSRVIMINKLNDMELENALIKSETSRRQNNNVSNILDISRYPYSIGVNLNHSLFSP
jgi:hypothetical protein